MKYKFASIQEFKARLSVSCIISKDQEIELYINGKKMLYIDIEGGVNILTPKYEFYRTDEIQIDKILNLSETSSTDENFPGNVLISGTSIAPKMATFEELALLEHLKKPKYKMYEEQN